MKRHQELLTAAIEREADGQRALMQGDEGAAREAFAEAAELYRQSWKEAPPGSYGRLVGMLKTAVLAGGGEEQAIYVNDVLGGTALDSATASYARALAALITGEDEAAVRASQGMRGASDAFDRTSEAIAALAAGESRRYAAAVEQVVRDFEQRTDHLTGVQIADTAVVLERLAAQRGLAASPRSAVMPSR